jgi:hypothetical protein
MQCLTPCLAFPLPSPPPPGESHTKSSHMVLDCCDSSFSPEQKKIRQKAEFCQTKPQPAISLIRGPQWIVHKISDVVASEVHAVTRFVTFNNLPALWGPSNQLFSPEKPRFSEIFYLRILFNLLSSIAAGIGIPASTIEGQQYTSKVSSSMEATVHKLGQYYQPWVMNECISSL